MLCAYHDNFLSDITGDSVHIVTSLALNISIQLDWNFYLIEKQKEFKITCHLSVVTHH